MAYNDLPPLGQDDMAGSLPVVIASDQAAFPVTVSGVATAAKQDTIIGHLDGVEGLLTTIDTDTGNIATSVANIDADTSAMVTDLAAIEVLLTTIEANQLADGHNVTIDNASIAVTGTFWQATQPVSGTVTAELSAVDNAVLDSIDADLTTIIGHVDGIETLLGTIDADTSAMVTALQILDNAISGNEMQVDVLTMPTVTVNTHAVTVASGGIASGAIASGAIASGAIASGAIAAGAIAAGATSIATTEDTASAAADHLVKVAQIRLDTPVSGANVSNSGDYTQFIADSFGKTWTAGTYPEDLAHVAGEPISGNGVRRIDTPATSAGSSGDWATMDASAEGALWTTNTPTTTGGVLTFKTLDLDETEEEIKATAGNVYGYYFFNAATSTRYLKWYNATAANVTVGTTTPVRTYPLPAGAAGHISLSYPIGFSTAITVAVTTGLADNDTGAPGANEVILNVDYK